MTSLRLDTRELVHQSPCGCKVTRHEHSNRARMIRAKSCRWHEDQKQRDLLFSQAKAKFQELM